LPVCLFRLMAALGEGHVQVTQAVYMCCTSCQA
jgi:hypothetical protein